MRSAIAFAIFALGVLRGAADAAAPLSGLRWSASAAGCTAGDSTIHDSRYLVTAGSVKHQEANTDLITLYCAVHDRPNFVNRLWVTYRNSAGSSTALTYVSASLIRMDIANGSITTIVTFNSTQFVDTGDTVNYVGFPAYTFDANRYYYYVRVDLKRNTSSDLVIFYGVALTYQ
jgi:hypothetical protein